MDHNTRTSLEAMHDATVIEHNQLARREAALHRELVEVQSRMAELTGNLEALNKALGNGTKAVTDFNTAVSKMGAVPRNFG